MQRITISVDDELAEAFEQFTREHGYQNRSEAFRDLVRERLGRERIEKAPRHQHCMATVSYVYNHHERMLGQRVTESQHEHHDLGVSSLHVHLDHDNCLEVMVLRGHLAEVRRYAESFVAQPGVRHGNVHVIPVESEPRHHQHHHHSKPI